MDEDRIYIEQLASWPAVSAKAANGDHPARDAKPARPGILDRTPNTIRQWVNQGHLPGHLMPSREGGRAKMFWTRSQISGLEAFAREREERRGWQH